MTPPRSELVNLFSGSTRHLASARLQTRPLREELEPPRIFSFLLLALAQDRFSSLAHTNGASCSIVETISMIDPFISIREGYGRPRNNRDIPPVIRQLYNDHVAGEGIVVTEDTFDEWVILVADALMHEPSFHALCLDNAVGLYASKPPKITLSKAWLIGIVLPGYYDAYKTFDEGFDDFISRYEEQIVDAAQLGINVLLQQSEGELEEAERVRNPLLTAMPVTELTPDMMALSLLARAEREATATHNRLLQSVTSLTPLLSSLPKVSALLARCKEPPTTNNPNILDRFGAQCLSKLDNANRTGGFPLKWGSTLAPLDDQEKRLIAAAKATELVLGRTVAGNRKLEKAVRDEKEQDHDGEQAKQKKKKRGQNDKDEVGSKNLEVLADPSALQIKLEKHFADQPTPVTYPCWSSPKGGPITVAHYGMKALSKLPAIAATMAMSEDREKRRYVVM